MESCWKRYNPAPAEPGRRSVLPGVVKTFAASLGLVAGFTFAALLGAFAQDTPQTPPRVPHPILLPQANRLPDANDQMAMREQQQKKKNYDVANAARLHQMATDSDMLVTLAMALKAEVDNTNSGHISANAIRKAEFIETLARGVKEKMKMTVTPN